MARKQRSSWGCVQRLGPNRYRLRWTDRGERKSEIVHGTRRDADDRMAELRATRSKAAQSRATVEEVFERYYWPECERTNAASTQKSVASFWRGRVKPKWGPVALSAIKPLAVQEWLLTLTPAVAWPSLKILRGVYRLAVMYEVVDRSPVDVRFEMPAKSDTGRTRQVVAAEDMEAYYAVAAAGGLPAVFILSACGGLRVGEAMGIKVGEIEREEVDGVVLACVHVTRQVNNEGVVLDRLKTKKSERWAAVGEPWASRLLALQDEACARGDTWLTDNGFGQPSPQHTVRWRWKQGQKEAGLTMIPLQNLRPTYATHMGDRQAPVESVARLMGHAKPDITYGTYERPDRSGYVAIAASIESS